MKILLSLVLVTVIGCGKPKNNLITLVEVNNSSLKLQLVIKTLTKEVNEALHCEVIAPVQNDGKRRIIELKSDDKLLREVSKLHEKESVAWAAYLDNKFVPYSNEEIVFQSKLLR
jgi:hypothetical protein